VLVALVAEGLSGAIVIAVAVIAVQQIESNFLHPVVVGRAVRVHPLAILLAVTAGAVTAGVIGALIAVPLTAVAARVAGYLSQSAPQAAGPAA
jgi:predicted PurR-regulated permease PerM